MNDVVVAASDPRVDDVASLLASHLALMRQVSPPEHVHALDLDALAAPGVTFLTARVDGELLGVGALQQIDGGRGEIKSMHTAVAARGRGVARQLVEHIIGLARDRDIEWLGLETGTQPEFAAARALYRTFGFAVCEPFEPYTANRYSTCMSIDLSAQ